MLAFAITIAITPQLATAHRTGVRIRCAMCGRRRPASGHVYGTRSPFLLSKERSASPGLRGIGSGERSHAPWPRLVPVQHSICRFGGAEGNTAAARFWGRFGFGICLGRGMRTRSRTRTPKSKAKAKMDECRGPIVFRATRATPSHVNPNFDPPHSPHALPLPAMACRAMLDASRGAGHVRRVTSRREILPAEASRCDA